MLGMLALQSSSSSTVLDLNHPGPLGQIPISSQLSLLSHETTSTANEDGMDSSNVVHGPPKDKESPPEKDLNLVTWDSADDSANPQNWSKRYKWVLTAVCCLITVNV